MSDQFPPQSNWPPQQPYPQQPMQRQPGYPPQKPMPLFQPQTHKPRRGGLLIGVIVLMVALLGLCGAADLMLSHGATSNSGTLDASSSPASSSATQPAATAKHFAIGQTVNVVDIWQITVKSAKTITNDNMDYPQNIGDVYLLADVSMKNVSPEWQYISSSLQWVLRDSSGQQYPETLLPDYTTAPNGKIGAGSPVKGVIVYEVPSSVRSFTLAFITSSGQTIFDVNV